MKKHKINLIILLFLFFSFCNEKNKNSDSVFSASKNEKRTRECPCDSILRIKKKGESFTRCLLGQSMIEIKIKPKDDTIEVTRYYSTDTKWHAQEYILVANNKMVYPEYAFFCDYKESANFYEITFIRNEYIRIGESGPFFESLIGSCAIIGNDTVNSIDTSIMIPKAKFKGIIQINKKMKSIYKGEKVVSYGHIIIEAENMIKYGNLLEQYKSINKFCNK